MAENNNGNMHPEENDTCTKIPFMCPLMCQGTYCNMWNNMTPAMSNMRQSSMMQNGNMWQSNTPEGMWQDAMPMRCPMCGAWNWSWYNMPGGMEGFHSAFPESN